ncbi:MAG: hypothetical protein J6S23_01735 [Clostridia bacterium]|nr:hypothetical protein [Clostridia bacterium]
MQAKVEEIVRDVAITKINEIIEWLSANGATKEDLEETVLQSGAVLSVYGRVGRVTAQKGDYTAEQVGAAAERHAEQHNVNGSDPISVKGIGAETMIRKTEVVLLASAWDEKAVPTQPVLVGGVLENDKIDIQPDSAVINQMLNDEVVAIYFGNENGVVTAYAVGAKPTADITLQITLTEVI